MPRDTCPQCPPGYLCFACEAKRSDRVLAHAIGNGLLRFQVGQKVKFDIDEILLDYGWQRCCPPLGLVAGFEGGTGLPMVVVDLDAFRCPHHGDLGHLVFPQNELEVA